MTTEELEERRPEKTRKERENLIAKEHGAVFIEKIGWPLTDGKPHDGRAPDYDDWNLNGDIIFWFEPMGCALEISSMGKTLIMGRKTLDSFPGGQPLKKRRNICPTRDPAFERDGVEVVHSVEEALALACYNFSFLAEAYNRPAVESHGKQASLL